MKKNTLVCCTNFINHYSLALSEKLMEVFVDYHLVVSEKLPKERKAMGFLVYDNLNFVVKAYENPDEARKYIIDADIVITGSYNYESHIGERLKLKKVVFFDSERLFKYNYVLNKASLIRNYYRHKNSNNALLLCVSAYAAGDYNSFGAFVNRTYKWGYFPEPKEYEDIDRLIEEKKHNSIVWAGRLIKWKHPEYCIEVAKKLKALGYNFNIDIIGNGEMETFLKKEITNNNLNEYVHLLGSMSPDKVRNIMEESEIYLFTSDKGEGWGVVLNEAMNSCCACISSYSAGSTPFLIKDGQNGMIYKNDDIYELLNKVKYLLDNREQIKQFGANAYKDIVNIWNPKEAARRLNMFVDTYVKGENIDSLFNDDILSKAQPIK